MRELEQTLENTGGIGHAYIVEGEVEGSVEAICAFCEGKLGCAIAGNPDFSVTRHDAFLLQFRSR